MTTPQHLQGETLATSSPTNSTFRKYLKVKTNLDGIPNEMRAIPHWVAWAAKPSRTGKPKPDKIPYTCVQQRRKEASSTDPQTWSDFEQAKSYFQTFEGKPQNAPIWGLGLVFSKEAKLTFIDLDGCLSNWNKETKTVSLTKLAGETVLSFGGWAELSVSAKGIHIFVAETIPEDQLSRHVNRSLDVECYTEKRYCATTGRWLRVERTEEGEYIGTVTDRDPALRLPSGEEARQSLVAFCRKAELLEKESRETKAAKAARIRKAESVDLKDDELLDKARSAKNGKLFCQLYDQGDLSGYGSASEARFALTSLVAFWCGPEPDRIFHIMDDSALIAGDDEQAKKWARLGRKEIAKVLESQTTFYSPKKHYILVGDKFVEDTRRIVKFSPSNVEMAMADLVAEMEPDTYVYGGRLAKIVKGMSGKQSYTQTGEQLPSASYIKPLSLDDITAISSCRIRWQRHSPAQKDWVDFLPPEIVSRNVFATQDCWRRFPVLTGVINAPHLRADGRTIISKEGYDAESGLFADFGQQDFPPVADAPSPDDVERAKDWLKDALSEFPFKDDASRSVAWAAILTGVMRRAVQAAPLFAFNAPTSGTGKSTLADLVAVIATGRTAEPLDYSPDPKELRKTLFSVLLKGAPVVLLDNIVGEVNASSLNIVLSQERMQDRILGASETATVPTTAVWLATGNNLTFVLDMTRRTLFCTLDSREERPAERHFRRELIPWAKENRGNLVWACLTLIRAALLASDSVIVSPMNGYNPWSQIVRRTLLFAGLTDPIETQRVIEARDPKRTTLLGVLTAWRAAYGSTPIAVSQILSDRSPEGRAVYAALIEAIPDLNETGNRRVGKWLQANRDKPIEGLILQNVGMYRGSATWNVEVITNNKKEEYTEDDFLV